MAKKDVYTYYTQCTDQLVQLNKSLADLKKLESTGADISGKYEYLENLVMMMKDNCEKLSYIMFLLNQPIFNFKKLKYLKENKELVDLFKTKGIDKEGILLSNNKILDKINEVLDTCKEIDNGKESTKGN